MSIILQPQDNEQTVESQVESIKQANSVMKTQMQRIHTKLFNQLWNNRLFSAKEIVEGFGTDAASLFQCSSNIQNILATVDKTYVPLTPNHEYTINQDGTVTVGNAISVTTTTTE